MKLTRAERATIAKAREAIETMRDRLAEEIEGRSDKWLESTAATDAESLIDALTNLAADLATVEDQS